MAVYIDQLRLMDALSAEEITHIDLGEEFRARFGNPYAVVHRGDLHGVFLRACREHPLIELRVKSEVSAYENEGASVTALLASGERVEGSLLVGADGLWSNVRKQLVADGRPRVSGHTTYRSVIPTDEMPEDLRWNAATLWAGPKCHIVHYPLSAGTCSTSSSPTTMTHRSLLPDCRSLKKRCAAASSTCMNGRAKSSATGKTGNCGSSAIVSP